MIHFSPQKGNHCDTTWKQFDFLLYVRRQYIRGIMNWIPAVLEHFFHTYKDLPVDQLKLILQRIDLKSFAKKNWLKIPSRCRENEIISMLIDYKIIGLLEPSGSDSVDLLPDSDASEGPYLSPFESVSCWSANSDALPDFTFMKVRTRLLTQKARKHSNLSKRTNIL